MGDVQKNRPFPGRNRLKADVAGVCACLVALYGLTGPAYAADWSVTSTLSQRVEVDDNYTVSSKSPGHVVGSITRLATAIEAVAPTHSFNLGHSFDLYQYAGPGDSVVSDEFNFDDFSIGFSKQRKLTTYGLSGSFTREPASISEFEDTGFTTVDADRLTFRADASASHQINRQNSVSLNVSATSVNFTEDDDDLNPFFSANTSLSWSHQFNRRTSASVSGNIGYSEFEDDRNTRSLVFSSTVGLSHRLTKRLSVSANLGVRMNKSNEDATLLLPASDDTDTGFTGDVSLDYQRSKHSNLSLSWSQGLVPSADGDLRNRTSINLSIDHRINRKSSLAMSIRSSLQEPSSGSGSEWRKTLSISPSYSRQLSPYWNADLGYLFRYSDSGSGATGSASSNKVFISVSRQFVVVP